MRLRWMFIVCLAGLLGACGQADGPGAPNPPRPRTTGAAYPTARPQPTLDVPTPRSSSTAVASATPAPANTQALAIPLCHFDPSATPPPPSDRTVDDWSFGEPKAILEVPAEKHFELIQWVPDSQSIGFTYQETGLLYDMHTIDTDTRLVEAHGAFEDSNIPPFWSAAANGIIHRNGHAPEFRLSRGTSNAQSLMVRHTATLLKPQFSPSGRFITTFDDQPSATTTLYEYNPTGYREVVAPTVKDPFTPMWIWNDQEDRVLRIGDGPYLMTMATSEVCRFVIPREMGQRQDTIRRAVWSPDGRKIALLVSNDPSQYGLSHLDLMVLDVETGALMTYAVESSYVLEVVWLDEQFLVAGIDDPATNTATYGLVLIDALTQAQRPILSEYVFDSTTYPSSLIIAPNRKTLAMQRFEKDTQRTRLYIVEIQ